MKTHRFSIKIAGASGQGINSVGELLSKALKNTGYKIFAYREYPSLIKGGSSSYQIDISDREITSSSSTCDVMVCLDRETMHRFMPSIKKGGVLIHSLVKYRVLDKDPVNPGDNINEAKFIEENDIKVEYIDALAKSRETYGTEIFANVDLTGFLWKLLGGEFDEIKKRIEITFGKKPKLLPTNIKILQEGFERETDLKTFELDFKKDVNWKDSYVLTGNHTLSMGAMQAGVRACYSYPMTPASSILSYMSKTYHETGILVKQAEDEITAAQLAIGSMFAGTRALVATSGGGFDLMTETISLSGMTEIPFVAILAQRSGPGTGLPTWSGGGDLNLAVYGSHGEFPRCVIAVSDAKSAYTLTQHAYNIADKYQIPVTILTEKQIAESLYNIDKLPENIKIERGLVSDGELDDLKADDRYGLTENGISKRWIPGTSDATYNSNSDEHWLDGNDSELLDQNELMYKKRMKKMDTLLNDLPEPIYHGDDKAEYVFVGWGSTKGPILDAFAECEKSSGFGYLHYDYIYPLRTEKLLSLVKDGKKIILVENNSMGQLGELIKSKISVEFDDKILKYNGRPIFVDEIISYITKKS